MNTNSKVNVDWEQIDWDKQDVVLSREIGCTREAVRQARNRMGKSKSKNAKLHTVKSAVLKLKDIDTAKKTLDELSKIAECHGSRVSVILKSLGKSFKRKRTNKSYDWDKFPKNWESLTDKEIAVLMGVKSPSLVAQWRNRHGYAKRPIKPVVSQRKEIQEVL